MTQNDLISDEIVIVGGHHGQLSDVIAPLFEKGEPIVKNIKEVLGGDVVYLAPIGNHEADKYAVGVYTLTERRIGNVWMHQAPALMEWMVKNELPYIAARITRINAECELLICKPDVPLNISYSPRYIKGEIMSWASEIDKTFIPKQKNIALTLALMKRKLKSGKICVDELKAHIRRVDEYMESDFSGEYLRESLVLHKMLVDSDDEEIRALADKLVYAFMKRGSHKHAQWWTENWLKEYFARFAESKHKTFYEVSDFTLEDIEMLLKKAPANLYHIYKVKPVCLARHLYYAALPQACYLRLLTLLAMHRVLECQTDKDAKTDMKNGTIGKKKLNMKKLAQAVENCQVYFWGNSSYGVVFCLCRDDYGMEPNKTAFKPMMDKLPYTKKLSYTCNENTIATAFVNNPIFNENINNWDSKNPMARIILLRDKLREELNL